MIVGYDIEENEIFFYNEETGAVEFIDAITFATPRQVEWGVEYTKIELLGEL